MRQLKKILLYMLKLSGLVGLFCGLGYVWMFFAFVMGNLNTAISDLLCFFVTVGIIIGYIYFAVWLSRFPRENTQTQETMPIQEEKKKTLILLIPLCIILLCIIFQDALKDVIEKSNVKRIYRQADEIIYYSHDMQKNLMDTPLTHNSILINYDKKNVTFIFDMDFAHMVSVDLQEQSISNPENLKLQYTISLNSGGIFNTYFSSDSDEEDTYYNSWTNGIEIIQADGTCWYAGMKRENLGFDQSPVCNILIAEKNADEIISYGKEKIQEYCAGYEYSTLFVDEKTPQIYHLTHNNRFHSFCYKTDIYPELDSKWKEKMDTLILKHTIELQHGHLYFYEDPNDLYQHNELLLVLELDNGRRYISDRWFNFDF